MFELVSSQITADKVLSIYCDNQNPESHLSGFLYAYNDDEVLIQHISADGLYDGYILILREDIIRLDFGGKYEQKIKMLYELRKQTHPTIPYGECLYLALLRFGMEQKLIVSIEWDNSILSGFVSQYNNDLIHLRLIDEYGNANGETVVLCDEIKSFAVDTSTEQNRYLLYKKREINHSL